MSEATITASTDVDPMTTVPDGPVADQRTASQFHGIAAPLRELSRLSTGRSVLGLAFDWSVIVACFVIAIQFPHPAVWICCAIAIAARQHGLLILMHDASHFRLLSNRKWNDRLSNWLCAWPLLVSTEGYRHNHLAHHFHLNTDDDPDWTRKDGKEDWRFPKTKRAFLLLLLRELCGGGFLEAVKSIRDLSGTKLRAAKDKPPAWQRVAYFGVVAALVTWAGLWVPVLLLWFLPAFTLLTVILRIRSIAEHFGVEGENHLNMSRNTHTRWWERFLFAPHNSGYHLDHHLFPSVPFYNLPRLHKLLNTVPEYARSSHQTTGFVAGSRSSFLQEITAGA